MALAFDGTVRALAQRVADVEGRGIATSDSLVTATGGTTARALRDIAADVATTRAALPGITARLYPFYVEGVADFNSAGFELPAGHASHPIPGASGYEVKLTVTGAAGGTTLVVNSGPITDCGVTTDGWAAVVEHDDGSWGSYTVRAADTVGGTLTIRPALRASVTGKTLANLHDAVNGQHLTPSGYKALAETIWRYPAWKATRGRVIARVREDETNGWEPYGGLPAARYSAPGQGNYFLTSATNQPLTSVANKRTRYARSFTPTAVGQGLSWTVQLGGRSGYVDTYVAVTYGTNPARVEVIIDGVTVLDRSTYGLERVAVRFRSATTGTIRVTASAYTAGDYYAVGATTWWETPSTVPVSLFPGGARVVYVGDSWGAFYDGVGPATLKARLVTQGGDLVNVASPGKTAQWARDNFQSLVLDNDPDVAIFEFFVNDYNALGQAGIATWQQNIAWLIDQSIANGIQPVVVMPIPTASTAQADNLVQYGAQIAEGGGRIEREDVVAAGVYAGTGSPVTLNARLAREYVISVPNATGFTVSSPTNGIPGQRLAVRIKNTSAGALGTITWDVAYRMAAWANPAAGTSRTIEFVFDGTSWVEVSRTPADVPN